jgi:hypothetical protein
MCFTKRTRNIRKKYRDKNNRNNRNNQVFPYPTPKFSTTEQIQCKECSLYFPIVSTDEIRGIQMICSGCHNFFHCGIAGTCYGPLCARETLPRAGSHIGEIHRQAWCIHCVPNIPKNKAKSSREEPCICSECSAQR